VSFKKFCIGDSKYKSPGKYNFGTYELIINPILCKVQIVIYKISQKQISLYKKNWYMTQNVALIKYDNSYFKTRIFIW